MRGMQGLQRILYLIIVVLGIYILYKTGQIILESPAVQKELDAGELQRLLEDEAARTWAPGYTAVIEGKDDGNLLGGFMSQVVPAYSYLVQGETETEVQSRQSESMQATEQAGMSGSGENAGQAGLPEDVQTEEQGNVQSETVESIQSGAVGDMQSTGEAGLPENVQTEVGSGVQSETVKSDQSGLSDSGKSAEQADTTQQGTQNGETLVTDTAVSETSAIREEETKSEVSQASSQSVISDALLTQLADFNYLLANYYTVDAGTSADEQLLDADVLLGEDLRIEKDSNVPQILIYHTHSQETFIDSEEGKLEDSIVGMGEVLAQELRDKYGYQVIHDTGVYDLVDGVLDRSAAYDYARQSIQQILAENPTIEVVIDLHRDGVDGQKFVTEVDGKPTSMVMFFNGISRDDKAQPLYWLENPYIQENLAFSLQMQLAAQEKYPGFTRNIYLKAERFNLHLRPRSLLIEAGTQLNTVEEEQNAMAVIAELLDTVLSGA